MEKMTQREIKFSRSVLYGRERQEQVSVVLVTHTSLPADPIRNRFTHKEIIFHLFVTLQVHVHQNGSGLKTSVCTLWNGDYILPYDKRLCAQCCCLYLITKRSVLFKTSIQNPSTLNFYKTIKIFSRKHRTVHLLANCHPYFYYRRDKF
jgi:hypothetical protein